MEFNKNNGKNLILTISGLAFIFLLSFIGNKTKKLFIEQKNSYATMTDKVFFFQSFLIRKKIVRLHDRSQFRL